MSYPDFKTASKISQTLFYFTYFYRFYNPFLLSKVAFVVIDDPKVADEVQAFILVYGE